MVWDPSDSAQEQRAIGLQFVSEVELSNLPGMSCILRVPSLCSSVTRVAYEWEHVWENLICPCVGTDANTDLSGPQKELLTWHWKLGVVIQ